MFIISIIINNIMESIQSFESLFALIRSTNANLPSDESLLAILGESPNWTMMDEFFAILDKYKEPNVRFEKWYSFEFIQITLVNKNDETRLMFKKIFPNRTTFVIEINKTINELVGEC